MMNSRTRTLRVVVACLISGATAGLLTALQCRHAESDCHIAALKALSSEPVSWALWLHWVNWLPGLVFGLLFALAAMQWTRFSGRRLLFFSLAAALIYIAAGLVFAAFLDFAGGDEFALIVWIWPAGLCAGLLGACLLSLAARQILFGAHSVLPASPPAIWLAAAVGALAGLAFVLICSYGEDRILLAWPLGFVLWQGLVGLALLPRSSSKAGPAAAAV